MNGYEVLLLFSVAWLAFSFLVLLVLSIRGQRWCRHYLEEHEEEKG